MNSSAFSALFPEITFSIVSHGQGCLIGNLLSDIAREIKVSYEIVLTLNIAEDEAFFSELNFPLITIIRNSAPKGFGSNHNMAFKKSSGKFFAVVNPDIRLMNFDLECLLSSFLIDKVGACGPAVFSSEGRLEDSVRKFPTIYDLFKRRFISKNSLDYLELRETSDVDWLAGMFLVFRRETFLLANGFDERYFMYMEDVDICRRLKLMGWVVCYEPKVRVVHDARRASQKSFRHLWWHVCSAYIFFFKCNNRHFFSKN